MLDTACRLSENCLSLSANDLSLPVIACHYLSLPAITCKLPDLLITCPLPAQGEKSPAQGVHVHVQSLKLTGQQDKITFCTTSRIPERFCVLLCLMIGKANREVYSSGVFVLDRFHCANTNTQSRQANGSRSKRLGQEHENSNLQKDSVRSFGLSFFQEHT